MLNSTTMQSPDGHNENFTYHCLTRSDFQSNLLVRVRSIPPEFLDGKRIAAVRDQFVEGAFPYSLRPGYRFHDCVSASMFQLKCGTGIEFTKTSLADFAWIDSLGYNVSNRRLRSDCEAWAGWDSIGLESSQDALGSEFTLEGAKIMHIRASQDVSRCEDIGR